MVVGDVNSTVACALVGTKLWIPVAHLEAGLRSGDRRMPEEINRLVTDAICDVLWTPSPDADENLAREGVPAEKIDRVGNIMIDSYEMMRAAIEADGTRDSLGLDAGRLRRRHAAPAVERGPPRDARAAGAALRGGVEGPAAGVRRASAHAQEARGVRAAGSADRRPPRITLTEPLGYIQFMNLVRTARAVITDSGGVQEETTYLGIPCLTLRENTERPITVTEGSNRLVKPEALCEQVQQVLTGRWPTGRRPALWDGQTAGRCVAALKRRAGLSPG